MALGKAFTAVADDASAAYYNPAGLTQIESPFVLEVGYMYSDPQVYIKVLDNDGKPYEPMYLLEQRDPSRDSDVSTGGIWLGIASNFAHIGVFNDPAGFLRNFAFGAVMFYPLADINRFWNPQRKQDPYHLRYNYSYCLLNSATSIAYKVTDWFSLGGGVLIRMDTFQSTEQNYVDLYSLMNVPGDTGFRLRLKRFFIFANQSTILPYCFYILRIIYP